LVDHTKVAESVPGPRQADTGRGAGPWRSPASTGAVASPSSAVGTGAVASPSSAVGTEAVASPSSAVGTEAVAVDTELAGVQSAAIRTSSLADLSSHHSCCCCHLRDWRGDLGTLTGC
jgi:hypothetical protein